MKPNIGSGDGGKTNLMDKRVWKDDERICVVGKIDELNSFLGLLISKVSFQDISKDLEIIQSHLFEIGAEIAYPAKKMIKKDHVKFIESKLEKYENELPQLKSFILPTGEISSLIHIIRTKCRELERYTVRLCKKENVSSEILAYLNRLSDLLFAIARVYNKRAGISEKEWKSRDL
ncbi:MAG: cob(I)yrinic acid a,c-diamide adenosyltransferase [Candidatus Aenigmatarchaeota archaeon]|nr:cob(I)yrinic acid a,c-diamide adenosyltransferase [Candidatus Aenigmarchaeota archaeon]